MSFHIFSSLFLLLQVFYIIYLRSWYLAVHSSSPLQYPPLLLFVISTHLPGFYMSYTQLLYEIYFVFRNLYFSTLPIWFLVSCYIQFCNHEKRSTYNSAPLCTSMPCTLLATFAFNVFHEWSSYLFTPDIIVGPFFRQTNRKVLAAIAS